MTWRARGGYVEREETHDEGGPVAIPIPRCSMFGRSYLEEAGVGEPNGRTEDASEVVSVLSRAVNRVFDRAPVMMHSIDGNAVLVSVNRRWTQRLGYKKEEVLGKRATEFLTEESKVRAVADTLPLFWRTGSARSVGYRMVRKDGGILDIELDAEVGILPGGKRCAYAALRDVGDLEQWEAARVTLKTLKELTNVQSRIGGALLDGEHDWRSPSVDHVPDVGPSGEFLGSIMELVGDIASSLRPLPRVQEEHLTAMIEQQQELVLVAKSIDKSLVDLGDIAIAAAERSRASSEDESESTSTSPPPWS